MAKIRLNESNIKKVVEKTLMGLCETAGDLTWELDGQKYTTSKNTYRGVPGTAFVSHGEWSDPEIWYNDESINANEIEDSLWNNFREETGSEDEDEFENWLEEKGTDYIKGQLDDYLFGMNENKNININNKMGKTIKLTEQDLHRMIEESVVRYLNENEMDEDWGNFKSKLGSAAKGAGAFFRNGGMNAAKSAYNDNRANYMDQQNQQQQDANTQAKQQIMAKYEKMKQNLQNQLNALDGQMQQELAQVEQGNVNYGNKAQNFRTNAQNARKAQYNFWNPQDQQPMS